jgi:outer membrane protein
MNIKRKISLLFTGLILWSGIVHGSPGVLETYVEMGLKSNLALKQQEFLLEKSLKALREAKGMFLPSISIEARYSRAGGGRYIDMPIGDLVNPLHQTLNQLLSLEGLPPAFPGNIPNQQIPFLRETEHETKLRLVQPVFQPALLYNRKIKRDLTGLERARLAVFKRQLVLDIKSAYFTYLKSVEVKKLLDNTRRLLTENLRISTSLFRNHKVTEEVVFRSKAELSKLEQQQAEAEKNNRLAAAYFNFLLNRPLDAEIRIETAPENPAVTDYSLESLMAQALQHRGEFSQLKEAIAAAGHSVGLHRSSVLPTVTAVVDWGFQGEKYRLTGADDYWMGSLLFSWNLFRGGQDAAKKEQARYEKKRLQTQYRELENQIRLEVMEAYHQLQVARKALASSKDLERSQKEAFSIVSKKYEQGMVPQIEYLKAREDYTNAGIQHIIAIYDFFIREARLERASAGFSADQNQ